MSEGAASSNTRDQRVAVAEAISAAIKKWDDWDGESGPDAPFDADWALDEILADVAIRALDGLVDTPETRAWKSYEERYHLDPTFHAQVEVGTHAIVNRWQRESALNQGPTDRQWHEAKVLAFTVLRAVDEYARALPVRTERTR